LDMVLAGRQIALREVELEGRCEQIQWGRVYETASTRTGSCGRKDLKCRFEATEKAWDARVIPGAGHSQP
jgi:hypothetical protein